MAEGPKDDPADDKPAPPVKAGQGKDEPAPPAKVASVEDELDAAAERIRSTAKWLVGTFGAIAGALVVGLQLSDIGKLEGDDRTIAAAGAIAALAAAILIVFLASLVLARGRVGLSDLAKRSRKDRLIEELERDPSLYAPYDSVAEFADAVSDEWAKQSRSWLAVQKAASKAKQIAPNEEFKETKRVLPGLNRINARLLAVARLEDLKIFFGRVSKAIVALALAAAIGAGAFFYVNNVPSEDGSALAVAQQPVLAVADLTAAGEEKLTSSFGNTCDLNRLEVVALSSSEDDWEVVSLPVRRCKTARARIAEDEGEVQPIDAVELDLPTR